MIDDLKLEMAITASTGGRMGPTEAPTEVSNLFPGAVSGRPKLVGQQRGNDEATRLPIAKAAFRPSVRADSPFANSPSAFQSGMRACPHTLHTPYGSATIGRQWDRRREGGTGAVLARSARRRRRPHATIDGKTNLGLAPHILNTSSFYAAHCCLPNGGNAPKLRKTHNSHFHRTTPPK